jgi:DNA-binding transcriptional LysR family regulator
VITDRDGSGVGVELRQLQYFVTVAEELHFGRAAARLHIVQPAVSQQVRRLERELGTPLFERSTRRVALTDAGRRLLPEARAALAAADRVASVAADLRRARGATLRLGTSAGLGDRLPALLATLGRTAPDVAVELVRWPSDRRLAAVADGTLDAALVRGGATRPGVRLETVWHDPLVAALPAAHPLAAGDAVRLADLADLVLRLPDRAANPALVDLVIGACRAAGFVPRLAPSAGDEDLLAALGAGAVPAWTVYYAARARQLEAAAPGVAFRRLVEPALALPTALALPPGDPGPARAALVAACRATAAA